MFVPVSPMSRLCILPFLPPSPSPLARLRLPVPSYFLCSSPCLSGSLVALLPSSPLNSRQTALPGHSTPAVLFWMTSADILWTYATRSFRPRAPSPPPQLSSTRPAVVAPSCTPTGLYTCLRFASRRPPPPIHSQDRTLLSEARVLQRTLPTPGGGLGYVEL